MNVQTLADCACDGEPECFHCDEPLPQTATAVLSGNVVEVTCPACGCITPFPSEGKQ